MSATVKELREWLAQFTDTERIGIDEGGLTLFVEDTDDKGLTIQPCFELDPADARQWFTEGTERIRCEQCGLPIPAPPEGASYGELLCDGCLERWENELGGLREGNDDDDDDD
jgi:hypothetical protein